MKKLIIPITIIACLALIFIPVHWKTIGESSNPPAESREADGTMTVAQQEIECDKYYSKYRITVQGKCTEGTMDVTLETGDGNKETFSLHSDDTKTFEYTGKKLLNRNIKVKTCAEYIITSQNTVDTKVEIKCSVIQMVLNQF